MTAPTILIVDDSAPMRRMIRSLLGKVVGVMHECSDGDEAQSAYERHRPDWVVMDVKMERMDGIAATRLLVAAHPEAKVVILTGYDERGLEKLARDAGAWGCLLKDDMLALRRIVTGQTGPP